MHVAGKLEKEVNSAGGESKLKHYVFTHVHFDIAYNGNRIVVSHHGAVSGHLTQCATITAELLGACNAVQL